jgi:hypothetical protein
MTESTPKKRPWNDRERLANAIVRARLDEDFIFPSSPEPGCNCSECRLALKCADAVLVVLKARKP